MVHNSLAPSRLGPLANDVAGSGDGGAGRAGEGGGVLRESGREGDGEM